MHSNHFAPQDLVLGEVVTAWDPILPNATGVFRLPGESFRLRVGCGQVALFVLSCPP
jgi:hypothetical protein